MSTEILTPGTEQQAAEEIDEQLLLGLEGDIAVLDGFIGLKLKDKIIVDIITSSRNEPNIVNVQECVAFVRGQIDNFCAEECARVYTLDDAMSSSRFKTKKSHGATDYTSLDMDNLEARYEASVFMRDMLTDLRDDEDMVEVYAESLLGDVREVAIAEAVVILKDQLQDSKTRETNLTKLVNTLEGELEGRDLQIWNTELATDSIEVTA